MVHSEILNPSSVSIRKLPANLQQSDLALFKHELKKTIPSTSLLRFDDVDVFPSGAIVRRGRIIPESLASASNLTTKLKLKVILERLRSKRAQLLETDTIWCTDDWSDGYFHWLTDALPRLYSVHEKITSGTLLLPGRYRNLEYIISSLAPFAIKDLKFVDRRTRCKKLIMPSHTAPTGNYNEKIIRDIRDIYASFYYSSPMSGLGDKIYISRSKASRRKIINEQECLRVLDAYGFKSVHFEDLSFEQQLMISKSARFIISNHGAGLTNMLFMNPGCSVFELRKYGDNLNNCYFTLASAVELRYFYQLCDSEHPDEDAKTANLIVDCELLKRNVERMLAS